MYAVKPLLPRINLGNPLTQGLVFDAPLFEGNGTSTLELIGQTGGTIVSSGATWENGVIGKDLDFSAAASSINFTVPSQVQSLSKFSLESYFYLRGTGGGGIGRLFHKGAGTSGRVMLYAASSSALTFETDWTGGGVTNKSNVTVGGNAWVHIVITLDGTSSSNAPLAYVNGKLTSTSDTLTGTGSLITDDSSLYIGNRGSANRNWDGKIAYVRYWNRILDEQEAKSLYQNPFQIYTQPRTNWLKSSTSVTVSPSVVTGAFTIPSPTISTVQNITVSPSVVTGAYTIPTPTITTTSGSTSSYVFNAIDTGIYMFQVGGGTFV